MVKLIIKLIFTIFLLNSCSMQTDNSNNYKVVDRIYTKNKENFIEIRKYGINGGATVGYRYKFYIISKRKSDCFLETEKDIKYKIEWTSINTIKIYLQSGDIVYLKGKIHIGSINFIITSFIYKHI